MRKFLFLPPPPPSPVPAVPVSKHTRIRLIIYLSNCLCATQLIIPAFMGLHMLRNDGAVDVKSKLQRALHIFTLVIGAFITVAGTYTVIQSIINAYNTGDVGGAFTCA